MVWLPLVMDGPWIEAGASCPQHRVIDELAFALWPSQRIAYIYYSHTSIG